MIQWSRAFGPHQEVYNSIELKFHQRSLYLINRRNETISWAYSIKIFRDNWTKQLPPEYVPKYIQQRWPKPFRSCLSKSFFNNVCPCICIRWGICELVNVFVSVTSCEKAAGCCWHIRDDSYLASWTFANFSPVEENWFAFCTGMNWHQRLYGSSASTLGYNVRSHSRP